MRLRLLALALTALVLAPLLAAQPAPPLDAKTKRDAAAALQRELRDRYVFPDVGEKAAARIAERLGAGAYDAAQTPVDFAQLLTDDLRAVAHDKHLGVDFHPPGGAPPSFGDPDIAAQLRLDNFGFTKVEHLGGNVGYLKLDMFADPSMAGDTAAAAMRFLSNSDAVIIDLRDNGGGKPDMVVLLSSYFFDRPTHLNDIYHRAGNTTRQFWTLPVVEGKRMPDVPLYILTSARTFSAAEGFSDHLQALHRATIVGEVTGGGANPGETVPLAGGFYAFIPNGRAINPITNSNWEGVGVKPDVAVPADAALDAAYERALTALAAKTTDARRKGALDWAIEGLRLKASHYTPPAGALAQYAGTYGPRSVTLKDGALWYARDGAPKRRLIPLAPDVFAIEGIDRVRLRFEREGAAVAKIVGLYDNGTTDESRRSG